MAQKQEPQTNRNNRYYLMLKTKVLFKRSFKA